MKKDKIQEIMARWTALQPLSERDRDMLSRRFTIDFNYNSNHIEGNTLTYGQTEILLLFGKIVGEAEVKDVQEMTASNVGLKMMTEEASIKNVPLTQNFIRTLHKTLLREDYTVYYNLPGGQPTSYVIHALADNKTNAICATASHKLQTSPEMIVSRLSFSHLREIMSVDDPLARYFYEQECIKCTWSVRELRRQISTNLYFRAGISANPEKMLSLPSVQGHDSAALQIRQPFTFEFLGLKAQETVDEHNLEDALIIHLQEFILELGKGFCFEARQKRIIIDDEYYYPDLVFYNRILHCGVIIELKNEEFSHENLGQLNAYVSYYKENEMQPGDNPPVGILLCTRKGKKMVEYALAGMDNQLFVSTYMLQLPDKKTLEDFLLKQLGE